MNWYSKEGLASIKKIFVGNKRNQNLILLLFLLIILLIATKYILNNRNVKQEDETVETYSTKVEITNDLETRLEKILGQIEGVEQVSVMVTYANTQKTIPVYDVKENIDTSETSTQKNTKSTTEKTVAYQENNGDRIPIVESTQNADLIGAIVVVKGEMSDNLIMNIKNAVASVCQIPVYKISVLIGR